MLSSWNRVWCTDTACLKSQSESLRPWLLLLMLVVVVVVVIVIMIINRTMRPNGSPVAHSGGCGFKSRPGKRLSGAEKLRVSLVPPSKFHTTPRPSHSTESVHHSSIISQLSNIHQSKAALSEPGIIFTAINNGMVGQDSSVGIATRYGLGGPGIESRWGRDFPHPSRPALGPTQPPIQWLPGLSWE